MLFYMEVNIGLSTKSKYIACVWGKCAEESIWTPERGGDRRMEKLT
jgi:hypothetical protein